ncbi:hypothetical protein DLJ53_17265 [Acuticoccus sediminis]|uniref:CTP synthetase n=1 Tax=Acuticoccus sediminis TaxID=2184697 RepID=A0A8B2NMV5_9HYPH|nr:hypothetical protein [Acuticoccus sediminis]RAI00977.1 hypothetical protein DLJ53_17265 [Acuticoccus sediminis]
MLKVTAIVHTIVAPTVMGVLIVLCLVTPGYGTGFWIVVAAVSGAVLSIPLSIYVARKILHLSGSGPS